MKTNPKDQALMENLEGGRLSKEGFLGDDKRPPLQIIREDQAELEARGVTPKALAGKMRELTKAGLAGMGTPVDHQGYRLTVEDYMGWMSCPFRDNRRAAKRTTIATRLQTGDTLQWTDMSIHLIEAHSFFQGIGSAYRLEPVALANFLGL